MLIPYPVHTDARGFLAETFRADHFHVNRFVQDNHAFSATKGTLRGLHFQFPNPVTKLVRVVKGKIWDVVVDIRPGSPTYGEHCGVELSEDSFFHLYVPEGCAHGYITLEPGTEVEYKLSDYFDPAYDRGIVWNDPDLAIDWPMPPEVLSTRDQGLPRLREVRHLF